MQLLGFLAELLIFSTIFKFIFVGWIGNTTNCIQLSDPIFIFWLLGLWCFEHNPRWLLLDPKVTDWCVYPHWPRDTKSYEDWHLRSISIVRQWYISIRFWDPSIGLPCQKIWNPPDCHMTDWSILITLDTIGKIPITILSVYRFRLVTYIYTCVYIYINIHIHICTHMYT